VTRVWELATGREQTSWTDPNTLLQASFDPTGELLVGSNFTQRGRVWRRDGTTVAELIGHTGSIFTSRWSRDGAFVLTASFDGTARIWDPRRGDLLAVLEDTSRHVQVWSASFSADGRYVVTTDNDGSATIWELPSTVTDLDPLLRCWVPFRIHEDRLVPVVLPRDCRASTP
jgi:WD40 repeat protein